MKRAVITLVFIFFALCFFGQDPVAKWRKEPVEIDGFAKEWFVPLRFFDSETKLFFAFANDSTNLYICFQSNDERNQVKINRAGMKVMLNAKGSEKHKTCIDFPLTDSKGNFEEELNEETKPDIPSLKNTFLLQNTNILTKGFTTQNGNYPLHTPSGINVAMNWDERNVMTYEIAIPLKELYGNNYTAKDLEKAILMIVEVNAITRTEEGSVDGSNAAMGAAGGGTGRGMTQTMPGGTGTIRKEKRPLFDKNKFKQKFVLNKG